MKKIISVFLSTLFILSTFGINSFAWTTSFATYDFTSPASNIDNGVAAFTANYTCLDGAAFTVAADTNNSGNYPHIISVSGNKIYNAESSNVEICTLEYGKSYKITLCYDWTGSDNYTPFTILVNGITVGTYNDSNNRASWNVRRFRVADVSGNIATTDFYVDYSDTYTDATALVNEYCTVVSGDGISRTGYSDFSLTLDSASQSKEAVLSGISSESGAALDIKRNETSLEAADTVADGDKLYVTSANGEITNIYDIILPEAPKASSSVYTVNNNGTISGILPYTPIDDVIANITALDGFETEGIYNGESKVTEGTAKDNYILKLTNGEEVKEYKLITLADNTYTSGQNFEIPGGGVEPNGASGHLIVKLDMTFKGSAFYLLNKKNTGGNIIFRVFADGKVRAFSNWSSDDKYSAPITLENGQKYNFELVIDGKNNYADLYCNGDFLKKYDGGLVGNAHVGIANSFTDLSCYSTDIANSEASITVGKIYDINAYYAENNNGNDYLYVDKVNVKVSAKSSEPAKLYIAAYDADGTLSYLKIHEITTAGGTIFAAYPGDNRKIKAFLWNSSITPLKYELIQDIAENQ